MYLKKEEKVSYLLVVVVFTEIKRAVTRVAIAASKTPTVSNDKNAQSGEHGQQKYPPSNLTNVYIYGKAKERISHLLLRLFFFFRDCRWLSTVSISHFFYAHPNT